MPRKKFERGRGGVMLERGKEDEMQGEGKLLQKKIVVGGVYA